VEGEDFLAAVDSNVGFNKANMLARQRLDYAVAREGDGLVATLKLTYDHTGSPAADPACDRNAGYGATYEDLAQRCYWNYLRVYAPGGSELIDATGLNDAATEPGERDTTTFTGDFTLKPGAQHVVTLRYRLPPTVGSAPYRLTVRKQAGTDANPLTITVGACRSETTLGRDATFKCDHGPQ
jgi:hypothetical protein